MKNLKDDIKIWMENQKVEEIFKEIGFRLLNDTSIEPQVVKQQLSEKIDCSLYLELLNKIFKSSTFLIKDEKGNLYGYKDDGTITYLGEDNFFVCKDLSLPKFKSETQFPTPKTSSK